MNGTICLSQIKLRDLLGWCAYFYITRVGIEITCMWYVALWKLIHLFWRKYVLKYLWWRHQMETFSALLAICAGNSPVTGEIPAQRPVTRSFDVFFDLHPNKRLSKQWWGWWYKTPSCPLWLYRNVKWRQHNIRNIITLWQGNAFRITNPLWGEPTGYLWVLSQRSSK